MPIKPIDAPTLKRWLDRGEVCLIDVREPAEHAAERIAGAASLPVGSVCAGQLPPLQGKKLVVHCLKGGRGATACQKLSAENPEMEIFNLEGGIAAWSALGYPTTKAA